MCGICGAIHLKGDPIEAPLLKSMADTLSHRGPDDEGYYMDRDTRDQSITAGLAHRRLSIIDIESGAQPLSNEDSSIWIVFNGEIYNYLDIRSELKDHGHVFKTNSDTETIVHAYEQWGKECVSRLRGMFAFALWDSNQKQLFLARDRVGIKPLYYYVDGKRFVFGSEIKSILAHPHVRKEICLEAVADYFTLLYVPAPKSIFKNVFKLEPGHSLCLDSGGGIKNHQYWDLAFSPLGDVTQGQWESRIREKLSEAVNIRLMSEVPLGAFLSGGVDSSAVVALMSAMTDDPVKTTAIGFNEDKFNELPFARAVARQFQTAHYEEQVTPDSISILDQLAWFYDEPFADPSSIPTYYVSRAARQKVTVCLSGDGGDENFAGYRRHYFDRLENKARALIPGFLRQGLISPIAAVYPKLDWAPRFLRAKTLLTNLSMEPVQGYFNSMSWFQDVRRDLLSPLNELRGYSSLDLFRNHYKNAPEDPLSAIQYIDVKTYLADDILTKVDRASMAHSLEVRVPLLDHEFMELAASVPSDLKLRGKEGKYIFKKSMESLLDSRTLYRPKQGFGMPVSQWFRRELKPSFEESVLAKDAVCKEILNPGTIERLWQEHQSGIRERGNELWALLVFEKWLRNWYA